ncbi:MAG TPA: hypothetical protein VGQ81_08320 [Acidobacteriota bacterium]|jgi:hypothetical protein|nr:hypothetical protein [Acidobacteriota bacterium]
MRVKTTPLKVSAGLMLTALALMLLCLTWFSPRTMALFLGLGLLCGGLSILLFLLYVIADLHSRRIL